jgi:3-dehydroquinate synthase
VPTTLLAQVDSSVGGKVGIDHPAGKNLIGAFHQPRAVYIDPLVLKSLPERQFRNGLAEVVKIATALDGQFFRYLTRHARSLTRTNSKLMETVVVRSAGLKAAVVEKDEYEGSLRKSLNLGHTIGHAIEAASNFRISHGEAVSIGMVVEAEIAVRLGLMERADKTVLERSLKALKLPTRVPRIGNRRVFFDALSVDKKSVGGKTKFVLPAGIGCSAIGVDVPLTLIEAIMDFR